MGDRFFDRHGPKAVFIGRWIAWVRFATAWLAGINGMRFRTFFAWNALGAVTWGLTYGLLGYFGGSAITGILSTVGVAAAVVLLAVFAGLWIAVRQRERRAARGFEAGAPPGEPADAPAGEPEGATSGRSPARRS
jgi:membrane protein DedA with SNARE-associated domain